MAGTGKADAAQNARIRDWASSRRLPCAGRGPIPALIKQAYQQAHGSPGSACTYP
jgi:hypothetical protein